MAETPEQLDIEGIEVDVEDALGRLGGPGVSQGPGSWSRQASCSARTVRSWPMESVHRFGRGRRSFGRTTVWTGSLPGGAALAVPALALGVGHVHLDLAEQARRRPKGGRRSRTSSPVRKPPAPAPRVTGLEGRGCVRPL